MKRFLAGMATGFWVLLAGTVFAKAAPEVPDTQVRVGMVLKTLNSQYWRTLAAGARDAAKAHQVDLILLGPPAEDAVEEQLALVREVLDQGIQVLVFSPSQPVRAVPVLMEAKQRGIPVIVVDTAMPDTFQDYAVFIGTANGVAGRQGAQGLLEKLNPGARVALMDGDPGNTTTGERIRAAEEVLRAAGLTIVAREAAYSDRERAYRIMQNLLQERSDIDGVFAANDEMALGALRALQQQGRHDVTVIGVDGTADALHSILRGELYGSLAQKPYEMGRLSIEGALDLVAGRVRERQILNSTELVTIANAQELLNFLSAILGKH
ncbi:MAG: sugar ABC transporter substrate-binding protein [Treponema sp.]|jgi:ribose transport system substrate-binding protein|nr:sugar ABC transporter substrate-binding protein [Treponema sp.]